ncbi:MAG: hypothetical protein A2677_03500 [Candidatus Komeilibacteria bacterium RIFCSPHIGHO2_01_FULL_52_14]|uniref:Glycosyltransferase subfamily 4-like N-terminal domain-containing protein n=1 Tax=Candidatus Komeilibacteria bacterium RIFCSPHIGHO2_01_FULL_52_14 TaxID=1798549 RepID=A0A1G2BKW3_9BACT|nr:MAG: hypothetical protein A2677_03500 [Candidatus Komeilibacteria bacterium RIFCSPHIGHO2_01_FULL_52_14]
MKKTLLLTHEYYPYRGGIAQYCYQIFRRLPADRYVVLTDQRDVARKQPVIVKSLISSFVRPSWLKGIRVVQRIVKKEGIEVIVTPHLLPLGNIALAMRRLHKIPYIVSLHGLDVNLALEKKRHQAVGILTAAQHVIANSQATLSAVRAACGEIPATVITPSYDAEKLIVHEPSRQMLLRRYEGRPVILTVGRLVRRKGQDTVIRAMPQIVRNVPDAQYVIVGNGPDYAYFSQLITELRLRRFVDIVTDVSDTSLGAYYSIASIFAMPTRAIGPDVEGFGIVYLEAAHFKLPIVAGKGGGAEEALGGDKNGILLSGESADEVADAIVNLLHDRELSAYLGSQAQSRLASLPTWDDQAQRFSALLK